MKQKHLYVIGPENGPVKIGLATDLSKRLSGLQVGCWELLLVHRAVPIAKGVDAFEVERAAHHKLKDCHIRGEWFDCDPAVAIGAMDAVFRYMKGARDEERWLIEKIMERARATDEADRIVRLRSRG